MRSASFWIERLELIRHPEGGYYRQTYRAAEELDGTALPARYGGSRPFSTAIYYLLEHPDFSAFHRLQSDEVWHFYLGAPLTLWLISPSGELKVFSLGPDPTRGQQFQAVVPAGHWFAASLEEPRSFALVGCTVAPGFDFADLELAERHALIGRFPQHRALIERLTR
ncbi:MAG: cupin domain-containing protein [Meiothermus sp.]|uniref:cupin domain-containing protein n=1 Tax=Meiothermus sp. TaxID=1955249 RepID=UPI0025D3522D|nr:cupin domain-containing protein [Meiothermus sp.]MCS7057700.1 cupin domain-containing protein [Meiothermus sp.]MCS7193435.1 cupin domain-containing protein [Meiothermus sp.]MCX7741489.1 cupin domain-containing protein [Meiothermus sp.]MDW8091361.1 cupin domain-containing protein [Meiothermus sp.]MDW8482394.1 cupin domain-containing protein [Meiothermus sp.]